MIAVPDTGGQCSAWNYQEQFTYRGRSLELHYQTEPPHGDFIYSLSLSLDGTRYRCGFTVGVCFSSVPPACWRRAFLSGASAR